MYKKKKKVQFARKELMSGEETFCSLRHATAASCCKIFCPQEKHPNGSFQHRVVSIASAQTEVTWRAAGFTRQS